MMGGDAEGFFPKSDQPNTDTYVPTVVNPVEFNHTEKKLMPREEEVNMEKIQDQDYEYVDFATSLGPIMKVHYFIKVEITLQTKFGLS